MNSRSQTMQKNANNYKKSIIIERMKSKRNKSLSPTNISKKHHQETEDLKSRVTGGRERVKQSEEHLWLQSEEHLWLIICKIHQVT